MFTQQGEWIVRKRLKASVFLVALLVAVSMGVVSCGSSDGGDVPEDISGTYTGTISTDGESHGVSAVVTQAGSAVTVLISVAGESPTAAKGTYGNGVLSLVAEGTTITLTASGNTISGDFSAEGRNLHLQLTKQ